MSPPPLPHAPKCCWRDTQPKCERLQTFYPTSSFAASWLKSFHLSIGNRKRQVLLQSATCPVLATVSARLAWQPCFIYFFSHAGFLHIFWWVDFTIPTNKTLIVLLSGKSLEILVWIWKGCAFQNSYWGWRVAQPLKARLTTKTATVGSFKHLWKQAVVAGMKYQKTSVFCFVLFFYCVLKCKLIFVWPLTRRL